MRRLREFTLVGLLYAAIFLVGGTMVLGYAWFMFGLSFGGVP